MVVEQPTCWEFISGCVNYRPGEETYRCDLVATSLATVCARVDSGVTWKTGYESFPSNMPLSDRITDMKWMHDDRRSGRAVFFVRSCVDVSIDR